LSCFIFIWKFVTRRWELGTVIQVPHQYTRNGPTIVLWDFVL